MTYQEFLEKRDNWNKAPMKDRHYYRFMGYRDGSGCPCGYVIGYYSDDQYEYYKSIGLCFIRMD